MATPPRIAQRASINTHGATAVPPRTTISTVIRASAPTPASSGHDVYAIPTQPHDMMIRNFSRFDTTEFYYDLHALTTTPRFDYADIFAYTHAAVIY
jgi:hypothetical protein